MSMLTPLCTVQCAKAALQRCNTHSASAIEQVESTINNPMTHSLSKDPFAILIDTDADWIISARSPFSRRSFQKAVSKNRLAPCSSHTHKLVRTQARVGNDKVIHPVRRAKQRPIDGVAVAAAAAHDRSISAEQQCCTTVVHSGRRRGINGNENDLAHSSCSLFCLFCFRDIFSSSPSSFSPLEQENSRP